MKKLLTTLLLLHSSFLILHSADTVMVNDNGTLAYPDATTFAQKNDLASTAKPYIYIDMMVDADADDTGRYNIRGYAAENYTYTKWIPYDVELKVVDNLTGELVYWFCSCPNAREGSTYYNHEARDVNAKVYYLARTNKSPDRPIWNEFVVSGSSYPKSSIYQAIISGYQGSGLNGVGGIVIVPGERLRGTSTSNPNGAYTKNFFNPNFSTFGRYSVIYLRISADGEETINGKHFWQAANIHTTGK